MTAQAIDVVISADRHSLDKGEFAKTAAIILRSEEFNEFVKKAVTVGVVEGLLHPTGTPLMQTALVAAFRAGYLTKEQEIGASELEAFFPQ